MWLLLPHVLLIAVFFIFLFIDFLFYHRRYRQQLKEALAKQRLQKVFPKRVISSLHRTTSFVPPPSVTFHRMSASKNYSSLPPIKEAENEQCLQNTENSHSMQESNKSLLVPRVRNGSKQKQSRLASLSKEENDFAHEDMGRSSKRIDSTLFMQKEFKTSSAEETARHKASTDGSTPELKDSERKEHRQAHPLPQISFFLIPPPQSGQNTNNVNTKLDPVPGLVSHALPPLRLGRVPENPHQQFAGLSSDPSLLSVLLSPEDINRVDCQSILCQNHKIAVAFQSNPTHYQGTFRT